MPETPIRLDVHHHVIAPEYLRTRRDDIAGVTSNTRHALDWTPQASLDQMDKTDVATVILSVSAPGVWFGDDAEARHLARICNEYSARLKADHPDRFGFFAAVPLPDVDGTLAEIEYALDTLKADGVGLLTSYGGKWLGDPALTPMYEELSRRRRPVYVHPTVPDCCRGLVPGVSPATVEFPFDTTRTITSMLAGGVFAHFPEIPFIFSHGGGALPMLASRIASSTRQVVEAPAIFRRLFYDTANITNPASFAALREITDVSQILFGTDFPFLQMDRCLGALRALNLSPDEFRCIAGDNARALFPRFAPR